jgi:hypothetical protein
MEDIGTKGYLNLGSLVVPPVGEKAIAKELVNIAAMLDDGRSELADGGRDAV